MRLSVVVPCYDEAENIPLLLERFRQVICDCDIDVILVDNGSTDSTAQVLEELLPKYPFARTVHVPVNQGYGYGILQGLAATDTDYVGWTHADMQTDPEDVVRAYKMVEKEPAQQVYIKGSRKGRPIFDRFFTAGMGCFESLYFETKINDINAQPNIFPKWFYDTWESPPHDFSLDLYALLMAQQAGLTVRRFPVRFPERIHGESKWNTGVRAKWKFIKRTLKYSSNLKHQLAKK